MPDRCRVVDARYLAPDIPAETPPKFEVAEGVRVIPVNDLPAWEGTTSQYVVVGSGKTATDACVWLLGRGVDPDAICWVRPRDPWMLNRSLIQPDPAIYLGMVAEMMRLAADARSLPELFGQLEDAGIMLRIDRSVTPTMAKAPTLGIWELDRLRSIEHVVRRGHIRVARRGRLDLEEGSVSLADDALVVNCAADGLKNPPLVPIWGSEMITLQPVRAGFPCFGAALAGYVEATRVDDAEKNRLCPPSSYGNSLSRLGPDERSGRTQHRRLLRRARHQAVDRPDRREPRDGSRPSTRVRPVWTTPWAGWAATSAPGWRAWPSSEISRPDLEDGLGERTRRTDVGLVRSRWPGRADGRARPRWR